MLQDVTSLFPQLSTRMKLTLPEVWPASNFFFRFIKTWGGWPRCMITLWNDWLFFLPRNPGGERLEKRNESRFLSLSLFFSLSLSICVHTRVHSGCMRDVMYVWMFFFLSLSLSLHSQRLLGKREPNSRNRRCSSPGFTSSILFSNGQARAI